MTFPLVVSPTRTALLNALGLFKGMGGVRFGIYADWIPKRLQGEFRKQKNVIVYPTIARCVSAVHQHSHLLTFGCTPALPHKTSFLFAQAFAKIERPRIDIQHGLFQEGYTLEFEPDRGEFIFSDALVSWSEYGRLTDPYPTSMTRDRKRIGIVSNLHWGRYTERDRVIFAQAVRKICRAFPNYIVEWRPHPAEFDQDGTHKYLHLIEPNLQIHDFATVDDRTINSFLDRMDVVFSTPSTTIADCQSVRVPCIVFEAGKLNLHASGTMTVARHASEVIDLMMRALDAPSAFIPQVLGNRPFDIASFADLLESPDLRVSEQACGYVEQLDSITSSLRFADA